MDDVGPIGPDKPAQFQSDTHVPASAPSNKVDGYSEGREVLQIEIIGVEANDAVVDRFVFCQPSNELDGLSFLPADPERINANRTRNDPQLGKRRGARRTTLR